MTSNNKTSISAFDSVVKSPACWFCVLMFLILIYAGVSSHLSRKQFHESCHLLCQKYEEHVEEITQDYHQWQEDRVHNSNVLSKRIENLVDSLSKLPVRSQIYLSNALHKELTELLYLGDHLGDSDTHHEMANFMNEVSIIQDRIVTHLQLHLDKIDRGYSAMEIWAAVLTVIFLVFSFYSLFKMEDFIKQGAEGVREIKDLKEDSDEYLKDIKLKISDNEKKMTDDLNESKKKFDEEASKRMKQIIDQNEIVDEELKKTLGKYESERMRLYEIVRQFEDDKRELIQSAKEDFSKEIDACRSQMEYLIANLERCSKELNNISEVANQMTDETIV